MSVLVDWGNFMGILDAVSTTSLWVDTRNGPPSDSEQCEVV